MNFSNLINKAKDTLTSVEVDIDENSLAGEIQKVFMDTFSLTLRIYKGEEGLAEANDKIGELAEEGAKKTNKAFKIRGTTQISSLKNFFETSYGIYIDIANKSDEHVVPENTTLGDASRGKYKAEIGIDKELKEKIIDLILQKRGFTLLHLFFNHAKPGVLYNVESLSKAEGFTNRRAKKIFELLKKPEINIFSSIFEVKTNEEFQLNKKYERDLKQIAYEARKALYEAVNKVGNYSDAELKEKLIKDLTGDGSVSPRLIMTYITLVKSENPVKLDEIKKAIYDNGLADDKFNMSSISQYMTRPSNDHVRQLLGWESKNNLPGAPKDNFYIKKPEYRILILEVLNELNSK